MDDKKLTALLSLLDDPNQEVFEHVQKSLSELTADVVPYLEDIWLESKDPFFQERLEQIINNIQFQNVKKELINWGKCSHPNLIEGAILVNRSYNPNLLTAPIWKIIDRIKRDVWLELNEQLTALEKVKILNHFFYNIYNYHALPPSKPTNWDGDISTVLSQKQGNYIIISIIYAGIAQALDLPIYGINLPDSVLLCYVDQEQTKLLGREKKNILFYINPIDKGNVFGQKELEYVVASKKIKSHIKHYQPTSNSSLIKRLVKHEINVYKHLNLDSFLPIFKELYKSIR